MHTHNGDSWPKTTTSNKKTHVTYMMLLPRGSHATVMMVRIANVQQNKTKKKAYC
ncbi:hypothetical protein EXN66_Car021309 [Channa argus]|uniref:Uncharacterized protein n=1 Tax=Channa argus TaxID=215402 RepID=A0A6G1QTS4_CHAAH|nr:hypothetical protein EXN66_Car021309 [Channa argus]